MLTAILSVGINPLFFTYSMNIYTIKIIIKIIEHGSKNLFQVYPIKYMKIINVHFIKISIRFRFTANIPSGKGEVFKMVDIYNITHDCNMLSYS